MFAIPEAGYVQLSIYDLAGREVARLWEAEGNTGKYHITWQSNTLPSGMYIAELKAGLMLARHKLTLVK